MTEAPEPSRLLRRPSKETGFWSWVTTVDHKRIGILYFVTAFTFFVIAGIQALLIRVQLAGPDGQVLNADQYNQLFTMHGLTMIFLALMPLSAGFFNYVLPLQIGARDVAFPRLNALSYWVFLLGGIFIYSSIFLGGMPDGGWFNYAPLSSEVGPDPGNTDVYAGHASRMLFYSVGLQIVGLASLIQAVNMVTTILNMRAPGMRLMRMPVFTWMSLVTNFLLLFAIPIIAVALWQLMFDVRFDGRYFDPTQGGDPILWQHMFWLFGHPEVYILILPAFGIVSEVLPVFSRKPVFGYSALVFSGLAIAFLGFGVWAHHMFASGLGPVANSAFALTTMFIAVPTGVKIFNWLGTIWGGRIRFTTALMFALGLVAMFTIGGLSGVTHAIVPHNYQHTDTYYVVAHFHYVLFGGTMFGIFAGVYYWFPKMTGRMLGERIGKWHFWLTFIGFNLTFAPMHIVGLQGMPRRIDSYPAGYGWEFWNQVETWGSFIIAFSVLLFLINVVWSKRHGEIAGDDPWDARTIEWMTTSPPPQHDWDVVPEVTARDELWHRKYAVGRGRGVRVPAGASHDHAGPEDEGEHHPEHIHMPDRSFYPLIVALGIFVMGYGPFTGGALMWGIIATGIAILLFGAFGWAFEPTAEEEH
ncbi:cytochrome c oxidase subunit I [Egibacter rhizosphaerae]|uniref:Cytochrome c oxidase subunit 1 n=2 Tax=Egibacter rhizosphaerae TaxID=1670831 RepID=A0A411YKV4_9ACTN|nr:cytochrome c oxidase subunit I [Egibacter rhizosphaerae]